MKHTGWKVLGDGPSRRIAEFKTNKGDDTMLSYDEAKDDVLRFLKEHIDPFLQRIDELENDDDRVSGALPPFKAWCSNYGTVVTAKTKKRAIELLETTRYSFNLDFNEAGGDWWYHLAHEEAVWIEETDEEGKGTDTYIKPVGRDEANHIIEEHLSPYRTMRLDELLSKVGEEIESTGESSDGTPYKLTTTIRRYEWQPDTIGVIVRLDDELKEGCRVWDSIDRDISELLVLSSVDWKKEGF
tara:strand:- start:1147 stop:1872 length:726 start_codon:yes stop_codon:yes gene_type:complete